MILRERAREAKAQAVMGLRHHLARVRRWALGQAELARSRGPEPAQLPAFVENTKATEGILDALASTLEAFSDNKAVEAGSLGRDLEALSKHLEQVGIHPGRGETAVDVDARKLEDAVREVIQYLRQAEAARAARAVSLGASTP